MANGIKQDKKGKWYISTTIKVNGDWRHFTRRGFDTKRQAEVCYYDEVEKWKQQKGETTNQCTIKGLFLLYEDIRKVKFRRNTIIKDWANYNTHLKQYENMDVRLFFEYYSIKSFYDKLLQEKNTSIQKKYRVIRLLYDLLSFAQTCQYISNETFARISSVLVKPQFDTTPNNNKRVIPQNEIKAFLSAVNDDSVYFYIFNLFVYLGARISEFIGILVSNIDFNNRIITIATQLEPTGNITTTLKTKGSYRDIPLNDSMIELLKKYIAKYKPKNKLFKISHTQFRRKLAEYEDKAGIPHYASHEFRHTKATQLAKVCKNISDVSMCARLLGHSNKMFLDTYCNHINIEKQRDLLDKIESDF